MRAYVIYSASVVFTVDLDAERTESAEVYADTLAHLDTGLAEPGAADWRHLHEAARRVVERDPRSVELVWSDER
jgi:hypothetical protein